MRRLARTLGHRTVFIGSSGTPIHGITAGRGRNASLLARLADPVGRGSRRRGRVPSGFLRPNSLFAVRVDWAASRLHPPGNRSGTRYKLLWRPPRGRRSGADRLLRNPSPPPGGARHRRGGGGTCYLRDGRGGVCKLGKLVALPATDGHQPHGGNAHLTPLPASDSRPIAIGRRRTRAAHSVEEGPGAPICRAWGGGGALSRRLLRRRSRGRDMGHFLFPVAELLHLVHSDQFGRIGGQRDRPGCRPRLGRHRLCYSTGR